MCSAGSFGQLKHIRELQHSLTTIKDSLAYTDVLNELADYNHYRHWDSVLHYAELAQGIAERHEYQRGIAGALTGKGVYYMTRNNYLSSRFNNDALRMYRKLGDSMRVALLLNNIAINFIFDGNYTKCVTHLYEADRVSRLAKQDTVRTIALLNLIDIDTTLSKRQRDSMLITARRIAERLKDEVMLSVCHQLEAMRLYDAGSKEEGLARMHEILKEAEAAGNYSNMAYIYNDIGQMILQMGGDTTHAIEYFTEGLAIAQRQHFFYIASLLMPQLASLYEKTGNPAKAYYYAQLQLDQAATLSAELQASGFTYLDYLNNERNLREAQARQSAQKRTIYLLILLTIVTAGLLFFLYRSEIASRNMARAQQQLRRETEARNRELEDWDQFHNMLISVMAHDLRAPFASILSITEAFKVIDLLSPEVIKTMMGSLQKTSEDSIRFMEGLLSWIASKRKAGKYQAEVFRMADVVRESNLFFTQAQEDKNVWLELDESLEKEAVFAEKNMLGFICRNILHNATKYAAAGKPITVRAFTEGNSVITAVTNHGKEMTEAEIRKIFQPEQAVMAKKEGLKGAGIAMIISQDMVQRMQGRIWAESEPGVGTTFYFSLPKAVSAEKTVAV